MRQLYFGDCLDVMRQKIGTETVDLIYLDPPFNSRRLNNKFLGPNQEIAFHEAWQWHEAVTHFYEVAGDVQLANIMDGLRRIHGEGATLAYLSYMAIRLRECHRVLKKTGSIYLHCDPTMSHSLKLLMDAIFGSHGRFLNEIIWSYRTGGVSQKYYARKHDTILFYSKSDKYTFNCLKERSYLTSSPPGFKNARVLNDHDGRQYTEVRVRDVWTINAIGRSAKERLGYPTQKPLELLNRIIETSSSKGQIVLDPFCGCGTAIHAAEQQNRQWIGIDICLNACRVIEDRLTKHFSHLSTTIAFDGIPKSVADAKALAERDKFQFEKWAISLIDGMEPNQQQRRDRGIDGRGRYPIGRGKFIDVVAQVKGGGANPTDVRALRGVLAPERADVGIFICFQEHLTKGMKDAAASGRYKGVPEVQICTIEELMDDKMPKFPKIR